MLSESESGPPAQPQPASGQLSSLGCTAAALDQVIKNLKFTEGCRLV